MQPHNRIQLLLWPLGGNHCFQDPYLWGIIIIIILIRIYSHHHYQKDDDNHHNYIKTGILVRKLHILMEGL